MDVKKEKTLIAFLIILGLAVVVTLVWRPITVLAFFQAAWSFVVARANEIRHGVGLTNTDFYIIDISSINYQTVLLLTSLAALPILTILLIGLCAITWRFVEKRRQDNYLKKIDNYLSILYLVPRNSAAWNETASSIMLKTGTKNSLNMLEDYLLDTILHENKKKAAARAMADYAKLTVRCKERIGFAYDRYIIAQNCRKAGLYNYEDAIPVMLSALSTRYWDIQHEVIKGFAMMGNIEAMVEGLEVVTEYKVLSDQKVVDALKSFRGTKFALHQKLLHHPNEKLAYFSLKSLNIMEARVLSSDISALLDSDSELLRIASAETIASLQDAKYIHNLLKGFEDPSWEVRAATARIFGSIICADAEKHLIKMASAPDWWIRQIAINSILKYPDPQNALSKVLDKDNCVYKGIYLNLESKGNLALFDKSRAI